MLLHGEHSFLLCAPGEAKPKAKAKQKTLPERTNAWKKLALDDKKHSKEGEEGEEEEEKEEDEKVDPETSKEKRSYAKARKFGRLLKAGQVPQDILQMYNEQSLQAKHPRLFKTELINRLFRKDKRGEFVMCLDDPKFLSWKKNVDTSFSSQETVGIPYSVMLWQTFHGNETAMQIAEQRGDIFESKGFWHHARVKAGRTKSTSDTMPLHGGSTELDVDQFSGMASFMSSRSWAQFGQSCGDQEGPALKRGKSSLALPDVTFPTAASSVKANKQLALPAPEPKVVKLSWKVLEKTVGDAKDANERLQRDSNRLVVKVRGAQDEKLIEKMRNMVAALSENLQTLQECQMWESIPNSNGNEKDKVESFFKQLAKKTEEVNEGMEEVKAVCKARGL